MVTRSARFSAPRFDALEPRRLLAADWTMLVYMAGDNNLEPNAIADINELEVVGSTSAVNVVVQFDRVAGYDSTNGNWTDTRRGLVAQDASTSTIGSVLTSVGELNTGSSNALRDFITWGTTIYPATHYALVIWDHGAGLGGMCFDETSAGDGLTVKELNQALNSASIHLDLAVFDACLMGEVEVAHEIAPYANVMVSSQEVIPLEGMPYDTVLADLTAGPSMDADDLARVFVQRYAQAQALSPGQDETLSAVSLVQIPALSAAIDDLADAFLTQNTDWGVLSMAESLASEYDNGLYHDLGQMLDYIEQHAANVVISAAAGTALAAYDDAVIDHWNNVWAVAGTGLSIYSPLFGSLTPPYTAGNFTFVADTAWETTLYAIDNPLGEVAVAQGLTDLVSGQVNSLDLGTAIMSTAGPTMAFVIRNDGLGQLVLGGVTVPTGFVATPLATPVLAAGQSTTFWITLQTDQAGIFAGQVSIASSDYDESSFTFPIGGVVSASGEVTVLDSQQTVLVDGTVAPIDFGIAAQFGPTVSQTFTIRNDGLDDLFLGTLQAPIGFTIVQPALTLLPPGQGTTFTVSLETAVMGAYAGEISFLNSDADESPFTFALAGTVEGPNLVPAGVTYAPGVYALGRDMVLSSIAFQNVGAAALMGDNDVRVQVRFSLDQVWGNADDVLALDRFVEVDNLPVGASTQPVQLALRTAFGDIPTGEYYVGVSINTDQAVPEMDYGDNTWWSAQPDMRLYDARRYSRLVNGGKLNFLDSSGRKVNITFSGLGYVDVLTQNARLGQRCGGDIVRIVANNTQVASQLKITSAGGATPVGDLLVMGSMKGIVAPQVTLVGKLEISGTIQQLTLGDLLPGEPIRIGTAAAAKPAALAFGRVAERSVTSLTPLKSLTALEWLDQDAVPDAITAASLDALTVKGDKKLGVRGDFQADLALLGGEAAVTLGNAKIAGELYQSRWDVVGAVGTVAVDGLASFCAIRGTGSMNSISFGAANQADVLAGVSPLAARHAENALQFITPATIKSYKITGVKNGPAPTFLFADSNLSAYSIGTVNLLDIRYDNSAIGFGIYAGVQTALPPIKSVKAQNTITRETWQWPARPGPDVERPDLQIRVW